MQSVVVWATSCRRLHWLVAPCCFPPTSLTFLSNHTQPTARCPHPCRFIAIGYDLKQRKPELSVAWAGDTFSEQVCGRVAALHLGAVG
jgi:hypothetical protein